MATLRDPDPAETARRRTAIAVLKIIDAAVEWRENLDGDDVDRLDAARRLRDAVDAWTRSVEVEHALAEGART